MCSGSALKLRAMVGSAVASTVPSSCSMNMALATISETVRALARGGSARDRQVEHRSADAARFTTTAIALIHAWTAACHNAALRRRDVGEFGGLVGQAARHRLVAVVVANELEARVGGDRAARDARRAPSCRSSRRACARHGRYGRRSCPGRRRWRLPLIHLDRQRVVRAMADHDVGAGVDRGMGDLAHVGQHFLVQPPMAGRHHDVGAARATLRRPRRRRADSRDRPR